jgi:ArsR family transcriptional regulator
MPFGLEQTGPFGPGYLLELYQKKNRVNLKFRQAGSAAESGYLFKKGLTYPVPLIYSKSTIWRENMKEFVKVMRAVSDTTRVKILKMLQRRCMCVCEVQTALGTAQSTASKHLKILEEAGLIAASKEGTWVNYSLADGMQSPYAASLIGNLKHWLEGDAEIIDLMKKLPGIRREEICKG